MHNKGKKYVNWNGTIKGLKSKYNVIEMGYPQLDLMKKIFQFQNQRDLLGLYYWGHGLPEGWVPHGDTIFADPNIDYYILEYAQMTNLTYKLGWGSINCCFAEQSKKHMFVENPLYWAITYDCVIWPLPGGGKIPEPKWWPF